MLRFLRIAILVTLVAVVAGCGQKTAQKAEPEAPAPTASATPAEPPAVQEQRPPVEPPAPAPAPIAAGPRATQSAPSGPPQSVEEFKEELALQDVFFEAGRADIGPSRTRFMKENARWILENPGYLVLIEGHTDAKGTPEARLAIADSRAKAAARFLLEEGVPNTRLFTINHGSDRPTCLEPPESCATRNRRVHFKVKKL
jgi:peptidoglycan-associated lipoprotein